MIEMTQDLAQQVIFDSLLKHDGNRAKAAKELDISLRTFYRYVDKYKLHEVLKRCGWHQHDGPPRGPRMNDAVIKSLILAHVNRHAGTVNLSTLTKEIYAEDTLATRGRMLKAMEELRRSGRLELNELTGIWKVLREK